MKFSKLEIALSNIVAAQKQTLTYQIFYHGYLRHQCVDFKPTCNLEQVQSGKKAQALCHPPPKEGNTLLLYVFHHILLGKL